MQAGTYAESLGGKSSLKEYLRKNGLRVGIIVAAPYIIFEFYRFISPALYENERRFTAPLILSSYLMFMMGLLFSYFILFPITFRFLAGYQVDRDVENLISLESYIDTLVFLSLAMGLVFEIPILSWLLGKLGILHRQQMQQYRRHHPHHRQPTHVFAL